MDLDLTNEAVTFSCFLARSQNCEKRLLASSCVSVRPYARMEQLGFHWTDFQKIQVSLKSEKKCRYFTWRPPGISYHLSLSSS